MDNSQPPASPDLTYTPDLELAFRLAIHRAAHDHTAAALIDELRRLYSAAGEPIPQILRPPTLLNIGDFYHVRAEG
jgi:hypothetical protein